jgi:putative copper resistance protein D
MAVSGVINAWVRVPVGDVLTSTYGLLVLAKIAALLVPPSWMARTLYRRWA